MRIMRLIINYITAYAVGDNKLSKGTRIKNDIVFQVI